MRETLEKALSLWGMDGATCQLVAARENQVFRVDHKGVTTAMRLHRKGYRSDGELWSELQWMNAVSKGGIRVPVPIAARSGDFLQLVDGIQIDMLTWLTATPMIPAKQGAGHADNTGQFRTLVRNLGRAMAQLHQMSDTWHKPAAFTRPVWDRQGLVGEAPVWGRFWENPTLSQQDRAMFQNVREVTNADLSRLEDTLDFGLIHADLVRENILVDGDNLHFIDFDDGGFGFRHFDLATTLMPYLDDPGFPAIQTALLEGYASLREIDPAPLALFMLLRSTTYVAWIIPRMDETGSPARNERFINRTRLLARNYLSSQNP